MPPEVGRRVMVSEVSLQQTGQTHSVIQLSSEQEIIQTSQASIRVQGKCLYSLGQALKCTLFSVFGGKIMDSSNHPSKLSSCSSSLPSSRSAWSPPHAQPPPRIAGGENLFPPAKLEENHCRPMGVGSSSGVQVRADKPAGAVAHIVFRDGRQVCRPDVGRGQIHVGQEGHTMHSTRPNRRFLFP